MNSRRVVLLVVLLVLFGGLLFGLSRLLESPPIASSGPGGAPEEASRPAAPESSAALARPEASPSATGEVDARAAVAIGSDPRTSEQNFDLADAAWIEGRVDFPVGSPDDETLRVWSLDLMGEAPDRPRLAFSMGDDPNGLLSELDGSRWAHRRPAADGTFRVPAPADAGHVLLLVDGRYLFLPERIDVEVLAPPAQLALRPELGAWILGRCTLGEGLARSELGTKIPVSIWGYSMGGGPGGRGRSAARQAQLDEELTFELRGVPAMQYALQVEPDGLYGARREAFDTQAGRRADVELVLERGAVVRGRVLDEAGAGVAEAQISTEFSNPMRMGMGSWMRGMDRDAVQSDAQGEFVLRGLPDGKVTIDASKRGHLRSEGRELELAKNGVQEGIELRLGRGGSLAGVVLDTQGQPVAGATLRAQVQVEKKRTRRMSWRPSDDYTAQSGAEGRFEISGLPEGPYTLIAWHSVADPEAAQPARPSAQPSAAVEAALGLTEEHVIVGGDPRVYVGRLEGLVAGARDLVLRLADPPGLAGRVVDENDAPVVDFSIAVDPDWSGDQITIPQSHAKSFSDEQGRFRLAGVPAGRFSAKFLAEGFVQNEDSVTVVVPQTEELVVRLSSAGTLRGVVLDPSGRPVNGAEVTKLSSGEGNPFMAMFGGEQDASTNERGEFELKPVGRGTWKLSARKEGWAHSAPLEVQVEAGKTLEGLVIQLRSGGTIAGRVFFKPGEQAGGRQVQIMSMDAGDMRSVAIDEAKTFRAEHLTPGNYQVVLQPDQAVIEELSNSAGEDANPAAMLAQIKMTACVVTEGQVTEVALGAPPEDPVKVSGRITRGGEPVTKAMLAVVHEGGALMQNMKFGKVEDDGRYEITLDKPGNVVFMVGQDFNERGAVEFHLTIPKVAEHRVDLSLPAGGIRGVVRGASGQALANVAIEVRRENSALSLMMLGSAELNLTDEEGRFFVENLHPGRYTLAAGGNSSTPFGDEAAPEHARAVKSGIDVPADRLVEGIELVLGKPGQVRGTVKDAAGVPIAGATIYVRNEQGELLHRMSSVTSDGTGVFTHSGLAEGRYTLSARTSSSASRESAPVSVQAGATASCDLVLEAGTLLIVTITDAEDRPVRAGVKILDERGVEQGAGLGMDAVMRMMSEGLNSTDQRFGPLPAGKYTVVITDPSGQTKKKPVTLSGKEERKLRFTLD